MDEVGLRAMKYTELCKQWKIVNRKTKVVGKAVHDLDEQAKIWALDVISRRRRESVNKRHKST